MVVCVLACATFDACPQHEHSLPTSRPNPPALLRHLGDGGLFLEYRGDGGEFDTDRGWLDFVPKRPWMPQNQVEGTRWSKADDRGRVKAEELRNMAAAELRPGEHAMLMGVPVGIPTGRKAMAARANPVTQLGGTNGLWCGAGPDAHHSRKLGPWLSSPLKKQAADKNNSPEKEDPVPEISAPSSGSEASA